MAYWQSHSGPLALCAQLQDWTEFRRNQIVRRRYWGRRRLAEYTRRVQDRRAAHHLPGQVDLKWDVAEQNRLDTWTEFQDYHIVLHAQEYVRKLKDTESDLAQSPDFQDANRLRSRLEFYKSSMRQHAILLEWIEKERQRMMLQDTPIPQLPHYASAAIVEAATESALHTSLSDKMTLLKRSQSRRKAPLRQRTSPKSPQRSVSTKGMERRTRSGRISRAPLRWAPE